MKKYPFYWIIAIVVVQIVACTSPKALQRQSKRLLETPIEASSVFEKSFTGFMLYDPADSLVLYESNPDKYFTPASNTKIFTLYACLKTLQDSIPALQYQEQEDMLVFWGTGDPSLLYPHFEYSDKVIDFLSNHPSDLYFSNRNFEDKRYGSGWAWDDYLYGYQVEKTGLPIYGNAVWVKHQKRDTSLDITPNFFRDSFELVASYLEDAPFLRRAEYDNQFQYNEPLLNAGAFTLKRSYTKANELTIPLLESLTNREIYALPINPTPIYTTQTLYSQPVDTVYQYMMEESDNFLAEQLLLICANQQLGYQNTDSIIQYVKKTWLADTPNELIWKDGSGLSRYNLFTPRSIVYLLNKMYKEEPFERLQLIFPEGGISGTIKNWYKSPTDQPYVFAKTGTLSNKHCLSGYLVAKSGKVLIFSFMHNHHITNSKPLKEEMERVLALIYEMY